MATSQLANAVGSFLASDITGVSNGSTLSSITESVSGTVSDTCNIVYNTDGNGNPYFELDGTTDATFPIANLPALTTLLNDSNWSFIAAYETTDDGGSSGYYFDYGDSANGALLRDNAVELGQRSSSNAYYIKSLGANVFTVAGIIHNSEYNAVEYGGSASNGFSNTGNISRVFRNGSFVKTSTQPYVPPTSETNMTLGSFDGNFGFEGKLYGLWFFNRLSQADYMETYKEILDQMGIDYPWLAAPYILTYLGDSIPAGVGASTGANDHNVGQLISEQLSIPDGWWHNGTAAGTTLEDIAIYYPETTSWIDEVCGKRQHTLVWEFFNSKDKVAADNYTNLQTIISGIKSQNYNNWVTVGTSKDAVSFSSADQLVRDAFNAEIVSNWQSWGADALLPIHLNTFIGLSGSADTYPTYHSSDNIHLDDLGMDELASEYVTVINTSAPSLPNYIAKPVVTVGQEYVIEENLSIGTRLNSVNTGVPAPLAVNTGGGTITLYTIDNNNFTIDSQGYPTLAAVLTTPVVVTPSVSATNEAGQGNNESISIEITDVDETTVPTLPAISTTLTLDSINNVVGGLLSRITIADVTGSVSLTGLDAARFSLSQVSNIVDVSLVDALPIGHYQAYMSAVNNDPDGTFSRTIISNLSVDVVVNTDVSTAYDYDLSCGIKRLQKLDKIKALEYGDPIRINLGREFKGDPRLRFTTTSPYQEIIKDATDGVVVGAINIDSENGNLYRKKEYVFYPIEQGTFSKGNWTCQVEDILDNAVRVEGNFNFTVE